MTLPSVNITGLEGALGVLPPSSGKILAVIGTSSAGTVNTPATFSRYQDLVTNFGYGIGVEAAAYHIALTGKPVCFVKATATTVGTATAVTFTGTGTSVITVDAGTNAYDDYEVVFLVTTGGTRGVAGVVFRYSLDGGRTYSALTALGTATNYTIPNSGVTIAFAAGTFVAADTATFRTTAQKWDSTALTNALTALGNSSVAWEIVEIAGAIVAADVDTIETTMTGWRAKNRFRMWVGGARIPNLAESEATYLSSLSTAFSAKATTYGAITAGGCETVSGISGRRYLRPVSFVAASREASVSQEINTAAVTLGSLPVTLTDDLGNPKHHDEYVSPGLDDARFYTLRTYGDSPQGVYVTRPRLFCAEGSDFQLVPHRRVMSLAESALAAYFIRRLNAPVQVDPDTGYILEEEALEIEDGAIKAMEAVLLDKPKASGVQFTLSRTDNILSTKTLTGDARIVPLGYTETLNISVGYTNPALQVG